LDTEFEIPCNTVVISAGLRPNVDLLEKMGVAIDPATGGPIVNKYLETTIPGGFLRLKRHGLAEKEYPEVRSITIWLDDYLWRLEGLTAIQIATHKGWIRVELELHKHFWRYVNGEWRISTEAKVKLDRKSRRLIIYLTLKKSVVAYEPRGFIAVDVNENHVAVLVDGSVYN